MRNRRLLAAAMAVALLAVGCGSNHPAAESSTTTSDAHQRSISSGDIDGWPLTVTSGVLRCDGASPGVGAVSFESGGSVYAVNGTAKDAGMAAIDPIWADNPAAAGLKLDIGPLIDAGLALC